MAPSEVRRKSPRRWLPLVLVVLALAVGAGAYFTGWWVPNEPSGTQLPVWGIDISRHQGAIDWDQVRKGDVSFVYIKATEGADFRDDHFITNWEACRRVGLAHAAYHYFTFKSSAAAQAANFIAVVPREDHGKVGDFVLPPAVDCEYAGNSSDLPAVADFQRELGVFIEKVRTYYEEDPVIYTSRDFQQKYLRGFSYLEDPAKPHVWVRAVVLTPKLAGFPAWTLWQFSEKARVPGIHGFVDRDVLNTGR